MHSFLNSPFSIGSLKLPHRLIQGPLAGISCAPFRQLFSQFTLPAYCVSEMLSAQNVLTRDDASGRYLYRAPDEGTLCYQISGTNPEIMAAAAAKLVDLGASLIDINCGCPKPKIRKNGAGSALLEDPARLIAVVKQVRAAIDCPLTVKIRLLDNSDTLLGLAQNIEAAGADALIVHGRRWLDEYDVPCDLGRIAAIKQVLTIPVIANGDISGPSSLYKTFTETGCDAVMISRAGTGKPWLFQSLLSGQAIAMNNFQLISLFMGHLRALAELENECKAVLQSKSLVRYYFRDQLDAEFLHAFYQLDSLQVIEGSLRDKLISAY